jgi:hypothetical protein
MIEKVKRHVDETGEMPGGGVSVREEMADIPEEMEREHSVEEGGVEGVARPDLNERALEDAREKVRKHGGGSGGGSEG